MTKRVVKKPAPKKSSIPVRHPETKLDTGAARELIDSKGVQGKRVPAEKVHKVVNLIVSIGDYDRKRSHEDLVKHIEKSLGGVPFGKDGLHVTVTGGYYVLDGKVCYPDDYDPKAQNFQAGKVPPEWAGGPKRTAAEMQRDKMEHDKNTLSSDAYDKKYHIGKYAPQPPPKPDRSKIITPAMQKAAAEERRKAKEIAAEEEEVEELDWDMDDVFDDDALGAVADESAKEAVQKMKKSKRVVKKTPTKKRTVKRK